MSEPDAVLAVTQVTTHVATALARLPVQFKNKPIIAALLRSYVARVQELEDALWALYTDTLDSAVGVRLDVLGRVLGEARGGLDDEPYRGVLRAAVLANRSSGTGPELLAVARKLLGVGPQFTLTEYRRMAVVVEPAEPWPSASAAARLLRKARSGGVDLQVIDPPARDFGDDWFAFAPGLTELYDPTRGFGDDADPAVGGLLVGVLT